MERPCNCNACSAALSRRACEQPPVLCAPCQLSAGTCNALRKGSAQLVVVGTRAHGSSASRPPFQSVRWALRVGSPFQWLPPRGAAQRAMPKAGQVRSACHRRFQPVRPALRVGRPCQWLPPRGAAQSARPRWLVASSTCLWCQPGCCLTLRSTRPVPAGLLGRVAVQPIIGLAPQASCRHGRVTSNVRPHKHPSRIVSHFLRA